MIAAPAATAKSSPGKSAGRAIREILETIVLAALIFFGVRLLVLNFKVDGQSMLPNLQNNELLLVNRNAYFDLGTSKITGWLPFWDDHDYLFGGPKRGDVIVFNPPLANNDKPFIKRVIGLPGDTVETRGGIVYVNGAALDEPYIDGKVTMCRNNTEDCAPVTVPDASVSSRSAAVDGRSSAPAAAAARASVEHVCAGSANPDRGS